MKTAAIYCRVSTQGQADDGTSLDTQQQLCEKYCKEKGYTVALTIKEARSGASLRRPGLDEVRDLAREGAVQAVIAYAPDRLSRDQADLLLVAKEFKLRKIELLFVTLPKDNSIFGEALFQMAGIFAEVERRTIQERTMRGKAQRVREGKVLVSRVFSYGYRAIIGEGRLEVIEHEAQWVRKMYDWMVFEGCSLGEIVRRLNEAGVRTQSGCDHWQRSTVQRILSNSVNAGTWYYNKRESVIPRNPKTPEHADKKWSKEWKPRSEWVGAAVPAIISEELYEAALRQLTRNRDMSPRNLKHQYLLKGLTVCAFCGYKLFAHAKDGGRRRFYRCSGRAKHQVHMPLDQRCPAGAYNGDKLEAKVWDRIIQIVSKPELIYQSLEAQEQETHAQRRRDDEALSSLEAIKLRVKREVHEVLDLYADGTIDKATLQERMALIKKKQDAVEKRLADATERTRQYEQASGNIATVRDFCERVQAGLPHLTHEDKRAFLEACNIEIAVSSLDDFTINGLINDLSLLLVEPQHVNNGGTSVYALSAQAQGRRAFAPATSPPAAPATTSSPIQAQTSTGKP